MDELDKDRTEEKLESKEIARRKVLRKAVLGTGAIASAPAWLKPALDTVVLPAHAQASTTTTLTTTTTTSTTTTSTTTATTPP